MDHVRKGYKASELRRFFASHARTFAHSIFGRTHVARTCAFCPKFNRTRTRTSYNFLKIFFLVLKFFLMNFVNLHHLGILMVKCSIKTV